MKCGVRNGECGMVLGTEKLRRLPMRGWRLRNSNDSLAAVRKRSAAPGFSAAMRSPVSRKSSQTGDLTSKFIAGEHYAYGLPIRRCRFMSWSFHPFAQHGRFREG